MIPPPLVREISYIAFLVFITYFLALMVFYFFLGLVGLFEGRRRAGQSEGEHYPLIYFSAFTIPVSIVIPAHNEENWIRETTLALLSLNYPEYEVIIVDDGSTDRTFSILDEVLGLRAVDKPYPKHYPDGKVDAIMRSDKHPNVTVIRHACGGKKAAAVNAGLNLAKYRYICSVDADTILERDALLKVMAYVERDPEHVIGVGSFFGLLNGFHVDEGRILDRSFSYRPLIAYQNLEYIRSFIGNRIAWSRYNATPIIAGGFAMWRRDVLYELGGYSGEFTCEDLEMTFRVQEYAIKHREKGYRLVMLPYYVCWTEGPSTIRALISQRNRWQRVTNETLWRYKHMIANPAYGPFALLALPYFILYEVLGVFFEIASVALVTIGWALGALDLRIFLTYFVFMVGSQALLSLISILAFIRTQRLFKLPYVAYLVLLSLVEFICYRWIISVAKLQGTYAYLKGVRTFDQYERSKHIKRKIGE